MAPKFKSNSLRSHKPTSFSSHYIYRYRSRKLQTVLIDSSYTYIHTLYTSAQRMHTWWRAKGSEFIVVSDGLYRGSCERDKREKGGGDDDPIAHRLFGK